MTPPPLPLTSVLVVDDEPLVRMCAVEMLEDGGFSVVEACDAEEALEQLALHPEISVLFTDINMPGAFDGLELARRVSAMRPDIVLLLTSGRAGPPKAALAGGAFIPKPYDGRAMPDLIRTAVRGREQTGA